MPRLLLALPLLVVLVLFALSNPQPVRLGLWPTDIALEVPVSVVVLAAMAASFVLGAVLLWVSLIGARLRARRAEQTARRLEAQVAELRAELVPLRAMAVRPGRAGHTPVLTTAPWRD